MTNMDSFLSTPSILSRTMNVGLLKNNLPINSWYLSSILKTK